jgi:hypothetical protein
LNHPNTLQLGQTGNLPASTSLSIVSQLLLLGTRQTDSHTKLISHFNISSDHARSGQVRSVSDGLADELVSRLHLMRLISTMSAETPVDRVTHHSRAGRWSLTVVVVMVVVMQGSSRNMYRAPGMRIGIRVESIQSFAASFQNSELSHSDRRLVRY